MALQIRRGLEAGRAAVTPAPGELLFTTDQSKLYIGDGATVGGTLVTGSGIGNVVEDTTPQLGGNLDVNSYSIVSTSNGNIILDPNGSGTIQLNANITTTGNITKTGELNITSTTFTSFGNDTTLVDGNVTITRNSYASTPGSGFLYQQHHNTADAVNFTFFRSRGTALARTSVVNNDDIADISFISNDGTAGVGVGNITCQVDGAVSTGRIPGRFGFLLHDGIISGTGGLREVAQLNSAGVWKVNAIQNLNGTDLTLTATTVNVAGNVQINAQGDLRFADTDSSNWVAFQAPGTVAANVTWTLPGADGTAGYVLSTDGSGTLTWVAQTGGGTSLQSRNTVAVTTTSLADTATGNVTFTGAAKGYVLYKIQTTGAAWVRLYTDISNRTADASRAEGVDPAAGAGVVAEVITTGAQTILISPGTLGFNNESSPVTEIYAAVTNKTGSTATITVTLTILKIEV
jgi:hypothetical protein